MSLTNWYNNKITNTNKIKILSLDGTIKLTIDCQINNKKLTTNITILKSFLFCLYKFLNSLNLFILYYMKKYILST